MDKISAIVDAAQELFAKQGYEHTSVSEIASMAGVAGGTIIYHFKNKENLLFIVTWKVLYSLYKKTLHVVPVASSGLGAVETFMRAFFDFLVENEAEYRIILKNTAFDTLDLEAFPNADLRMILTRYMQLLEDAVSRGIRDGSIYSDIDARTSSLTIYSLLLGSARLYIQHREPAENMLQEAVAFTRARLAS